MNPAYKEAHHEANHLFHRTEALIDDHHHEMAEGIAKDARNVLEDIESNKKPRAVEDRIKQLQHRLEHLKASPNSAMTPQDAGRLAEEYEQLRRRLRGLPNY